MRTSSKRQHTLALVAIILPTLATAASNCACGYTVNASTSPSHATFTEILETDFLHAASIPSSQWTPQAYNVTQALSNGPFGKAALVENVISNPLTGSQWDWGGEGEDGRDPGLKLWVRSTKVEGDLVPMAEIVSVRGDVLYGSFRVGMKGSGVNGTCGAFFFYFNDTEEIDMEFLSKQPGMANLVIQSLESEALGYVNPGSEDFDQEVLGFEVGSGYHEYRFDWMPDRVDFFADSVLISSIRDNIPRAAGRIHISHWSNGNPGWSAGPPEQDAVITVSYIKAYFNSSDTSTTAQSLTECTDQEKQQLDCQIPDVTTPPDPTGPNGNSTGRTSFFQPQNETQNISGSGNESTDGSPTKGVSGRYGIPESSIWVGLMIAIMGSV